VTLIRKKAGEVVMAVAAVTIVLLATLPDLMTGWFPHDEGQIGQAAERFLRGELPHRDFDDMYTGLLTVLHGGAFKLLGMRTESTRWFLLVASIPFWWSIYCVARRWLSAVDSAGVVVLCGLWSVRLNPESLPSWYILFLTVIQLDVLLRFLDTKRLRWLLAAGVLAGTALLFKLTGVYLIALGILFLIDYEQRCCLPGARRSIVFSGWIVFCLLIYSLAASRLWSSADPLMSAVHLTLPALGLGLVLLHGEWRKGRGALVERTRRWLRLQTVFISGVLLPVGSWLLFYWSEDALAALYEGVLVLPQRRLEHAGAPFPGGMSLLISGASGAVVFLAVTHRGRSLSEGGARREPRFLACGLPCVLLVAACLSDRGRLVCFQAVRNLTPFVVGALLVVAARARLATEGSRTFAAAATLAMGAMVQFPFALDSYFLYVVPLVFLGASLLWCSLGTVPATESHWLAPGRVLVIGLGLFALLELKSVIPLGTVNGAPRNVSGIRLNVARCGLCVERSLGQVYEQLVREIQRRTSAGEAILAGPDCPEVYFLSERRNPTRVFYNFFRPELLRARAEFDTIAEREGIRLVVVKQPFLREFSQDAGELELWARERFGEPLALRFSDHPDSAGPVLFNVYSDRSDVKAGELARRE